MHVATLSIIVNNKTLQAVNYVSCNLTVIVGGLSTNDKPYIDIFIITNPYEPNMLILTLSISQVHTSQTCLAIRECPMATECANPTKLNIITDAALKEQLLNTQLMIIVYILCNIIIV